MQVHLGLLYIDLISSSDGSCNGIFFLLGVRITYLLMKWDVLASSASSGLHLPAITLSSDVRTLPNTYGLILDRNGLAMVGCNVYA
jgi:hypothetical protein